MSINAYLGIDVGSVTTKLALVDEKGKYIDSYMLKTAGKPVEAVQNGLKQIVAQATQEYNIQGVGTTGSGRNLAGALVGADVIKNEITAHAVAASTNVEGVQTILEIGGQDSKIIILRDGIVTDFAMNTVCAAGTGSFLDHQAQRLNVPIEKFGETALRSTNPARIAGRCGVFAESDLIHKQQLGYPVEDLLYGLCQALVRNYLSNLALGKEILPTVTFQGGVATNSGMVKAFEEAVNATKEQLTKLKEPTQPKRTDSMSDEYFETALRNYQSELKVYKTKKAESISTNKHYFLYLSQKRRAV